MNVVKKIIMANSFFLIVLYMGCKKEEHKTYYLPEPMKEYICFDAGSYWVFQDSLTGNSDSVNLTESTIKMLQDQSSDVEVLYQYYYHSYEAATYNYFTNLIYPDKYSYTYGGGAGEFFYKDNLQLGESLGGIEYIENFDSIFVTNCWYFNVMCFRNKYDAVYYWARGVGVIKRTDGDGQCDWNWKIVRYSLI